MARYWTPKYPVVCGQCGWKGKRTRPTSHRPCPRCGAPRPAWAEYRVGRFLMRGREVISELEDDD